MDSIKLTHIDATLRQTDLSSSIRNFEWYLWTLLALNSLLGLTVGAPPKPLIRLESDSGFNNPDAATFKS